MRKNRSVLFQNLKFNFQAKIFIDPTYFIDQTYIALFNRNDQMMVKIRKLNIYNR